MNKHLRDLTHGPLALQILLFSIPLMLSNLLQVLFNLADVAVVGRFAGAMALGSVGSTSTMVNMFTGFLIGMASGINVLVALYYGAKDEHAVRETVHSALIISFIAGIILMLIGVGGSRTLLSMMHTKPELIDGAVLYIRIYFLGMPAMAIYNFGNAVFSASGDTKKPLLFLSIAGAINVILNLFFVIVCQLSVVGVALASIISQYISAILILIALFRAHGMQRISLEYMRLEKGKARNILAIGIPSGCQNALFQVANLFVQTGVNSFSATVVAANSAAANADNIVYDVMQAFYTACGSFMGQNFGARNKKRVRNSYLISVLYAFGSGLLLGLFLAFFGRQFLSIFTTEPEVIAEGIKRLTIMGLSYGFSAFMDCSIVASRAFGKSIAPMVMVILGACVFRVLWIYTIFAFFHTIYSLYLLYIFSWTFTGIGETIYLYRTYKTQTADM